MPKKSKQSSKNSPRDIVESEEIEKSENIHARNVICERLNRFSSFLSPQINENLENIDRFQIECRLKSVEEDFSEFDKIQTRLEFLDIDEKENRLSTESVFYSQISQAKRLISRSQSLTENNANYGIQNHLVAEVSQASSVSRPAVNLPDLGLPKFYGNCENWYSFWDQFQAVVDNRTDVSDVRKLMYLKSCCVGDALKLIESIDLTSDNYTIAVELLKKRFENRRVIINSHINTILFKLPSVPRESSSLLRNLLDSLHQHLSALKKLKLPVDSWDSLLIPIILQKLDERTRRDWENKLIDQRLPSLAEFIEFLTKKCFSLEAVQVTTQFTKTNIQNYNQHKPSFNSNNYRRVVGHAHVQTDQNYKKTLECFVCKGNHFIYQCPQFSSLSISDKYNELRKYNICSNCLRFGHDQQVCLSSGCKICNQKHNTCLHSNTHKQNNRTENDSQNQNQSYRRDMQFRTSRTPNDNPNRGRPRPTMCVIEQSNNASSENIAENFEICEEDDSVSNQNITQTYTTIDSNQVLLSTANILVQNKDQNWVKCTALLDSGSQSNLISASFCDKLGISCEKINIPLIGINQVETKIHSKTKTKIKSRFEKFNAELQFLIIEKITEKLPMSRFEKSLLKLPPNINLADECFHIPKQIDMLLGAGIFFDLLKTGKLKLGIDKPILQETYLGWIVTGNLFNNELNANAKQVSNINTTKVSNKQLNDALTKFWQIEELETNIPSSRNDQFCENYFKATTTRKENGAFIVKYPFKQEFDKTLGDSKAIALKRFRNLEYRFSKNNDLKTKYVEFMRDYELLGHMKFKNLLDEDKSIERRSYFLPHSAVLRESAVTTKCRVVFDASAKSSSDVSFNDLILVGPTIQPDLYSILLRLRLRLYVLGADIKMMYRCIEIEASERSYQQIIWRENPVDDLKVYELNTVTYGTSSAPFQATRCLKELALENKIKYPRTSKLIEHCFYMDDLLTSVDSKEEAIEIYKELSKIFLDANFELRKWCSNDNDILNYILTTSKIQDDNLVLFQTEKELKTLGIRWDVNNDSLKYNINIAHHDNKKITKRTILSIISQIFDPLGLIGPAIIKAKLIMQQLWHLQLDWDSEIPEVLRNYWLDFLSQIEFLNQIKIQRHVLSSKASKIELIGFSDSSERAYGACVYLVSFTEHGKLINLLTAKSRVAPLKKQSLPLLELLAAVLLAELTLKVKNTLDITISKTMYFTDSTIVLSWLKIEPCNLKTFVANRVVRITDISKLQEWNHVKTKDNPADIISRGLNPKELIENKFWFHGPEFLHQTNVYENSVNSTQINLQDLPEIKTLSLVSYEQNQIIPELDIFEKYSNYFKLIRVVAYMFRFKLRLLNKIKVASKVLTIEELKFAKRKLIQLAQLQTFGREISDLKRVKVINKQSKILNLTPFLDSDEILRVGGRLSHSALPFNQRHPIILPYKHKLTDLIIRDQHYKNLHAGTQNLLSIIRLNFWPVNGKNAVKRIVKSCIICYKANPKPAKFLMGDLPGTRVTPSRPFSNCGIDYAGPIYIKENSLRRSRLIKTYLCIFVCFATRACHIELAKDLTTTSFLNVLKRFVSRRGKPENIYSDNGLNFVGANNHFLELHRLLNDNKHRDKVINFLVNDGIQWHFNPARSPHMGGLWEAAVKSTKFHLKRVLGEANVSFEEMYTLIVQIEACLNSRPLTPLSNDPQDYLPLTPSHFLIGNSLASIPEEDVINVNTRKLDRYHRLQQLKQQFWQRWSRLSHSTSNSLQMETR